MIDQHQLQDFDTDFLSQLTQEQVMHIRLSQSLYCWLQMHTYDRQLSFQAKVYQQNSPLIVDSYLHQVMVHMMKQQSWDQRIRIFANREVFLQLKYQCSHTSKAQMLKQHYSNVIKDIRHLTFKLLALIEHPKYVSKQITQSLNNINTYLKESNKYRFSKDNPNLADASAEKIFRQIAKIKKSNIDMPYIGYLTPQEVISLKQQFNQTIDSFHSQSKQSKFKLSEVIQSTTPSSKYFQLSSDLFWKIKVLLNLSKTLYQSVYKSKKAQNIHFDKDSVFVDRDGDVYVEFQTDIFEEEVEHHTYQYDISEFYQNVMKLQKAGIQKKFVVYLGIVMFELLFGQVPTCEHPKGLQKNNLEIVMVNPNLGFFEKLQKSRIHSQLMSLTMKCVLVSSSVDLENVPYLDWVCLIVSRVSDMMNR